MPLDFNELGIIGQVDWSYEEYFDAMELTEEEKKKRVKLAEQFEILFLYFFLLYLEQREMDFVAMIHEKYVEIATEFLNQKSVPAYINSYAEELAEEIVRVTEEHEGREFYTSKDRGMLISANQANLLGNYSQQIKAVKEGKRYKTWVTEKDSRVRHTHRAVDEKTISIFEPFQVGDSLMMFPHDMETYGASMEEIANCRCVVKYS